MDGWFNSVDYQFGDCKANGWKNINLCSYYSTYGHVEKLAQEIKKGAASVEGVEAKLWQVCLSFLFNDVIYVSVT